MTVEEKEDRLRRRRNLRAERNNAESVIIGESENSTNETRTEGNREEKL